MKAKTKQVEKTSDVKTVSVTVEKTKESNWVKFKNWTKRQWNKLFKKETEQPIDVKPTEEPKVVEPVKKTVKTVQKQTVKTPKQTKQPVKQPKQAVKKQVKKQPKKESK
jgi:hypothetical protein